MFGIYEITKLGIVTLFIGGLVVGFFIGFLSSPSKEITLDDLTNAQLEILQEEQRYIDIAQSCNIPIETVEYVLSIEEADFITNDNICTEEEEKLLADLIPLLIFK